MVGVSVGVSVGICVGVLVAVAVGTSVEVGVALGSGVAFAAHPARNNKTKKTERIFLIINSKVR